MKLKVGDRVRMYGYTWSGRSVNRLTGTVAERRYFSKEDAEDKELILVHVDDRDERRLVHPKQCRKLKLKAKPREVYVGFSHKGIPVDVQEDKPEIRNLDWKLFRGVVE